jgi:hypothetical protein
MIPVSKMKLSRWPSVFQLVENYEVGEWHLQYLEFRNLIYCFKFCIILTAVNVFTESELKQPILKLMGSSALMLIIFVNMTLPLSHDHQAVS